MPLPHRNIGSLGGAGSSPTPLVSPRPQIVGNNVANGPRTEPLDFSNPLQSPTTAENGQDEVDHISQQLTELQSELFVSLKEDISEWIVKTLGDVDINADNFIQALDTGVILCRLSMAIESNAQELVRQGKLSDPLPTFKLHCNKNAKSSTWFARDNTANFLGWCRAYGMTDETLFDSEDLVTHHQERQVIYCLMELARLGARFGLEPPTLITMEKEIDEGLLPPPPHLPPTPPIEILSRKETPPPPADSPPPSTPPPKKTSVQSSRASTVSTLDSEVNRVSKKCKCQEYVNKLSEGVYDVFGKKVFIRLLKGKHLMVRVGGGWDTFENYLLHHDPVQVFEFHPNSPYGPVHSTAVSKPGYTPGAFNGYLVIRSKYKSKSFDTS